MMIIACLQIGVGIIQVVGSLLRYWALPKAPYHKDLEKYFLLVWAYFVLGFLLYQFSDHCLHGFDVFKSMATVFYLFVVPWVLAAYYMYIVYIKEEEINPEPRVSNDKEFVNPIIY